MVLDASGTKRCPKHRAQPCVNWRQLPQYTLNTEQTREDSDAITASLVHPSKYFQITGHRNGRKDSCNPAGFTEPHQLLLADIQLASGVIIRGRVTPSAFLRLSMVDHVPINECLCIAAFLYMQLEITIGAFLYISIDSWCSRGQSIFTQNYLDIQGKHIDWSLHLHVTPYLALSADQTRARNETQPVEKIASKGQGCIRDLLQKPLTP